MPSGFYTNAAYLIANGGLDLASDNYKVLLVGVSAGGYVFNSAHTYIDNGASDSTNVKFNELVATNYTGGFGGAGRKLITKTTTSDPTNGRAKLVLANLTWSALGGATNDTIAAGIVVKEVSADTSSLLIAYWLLPSNPTNGSDFTLTMDPTNGNLRINV